MGSLDNALIAARKRLQNLRSGPMREFGDPDRLVRAALEELEVALEELGVAGEELQQSNEELIRSRQELELERERFRKLFEHAPDGYLVVDGNGLIEEANHAAVDLLESPLRRHLGRPFAMFVVDDDRPKFRSCLAAVEVGSSNTRWDLRLKRSESDPVTAQLSVSPETGHDGKISRYRILVYETTAPSNGAGGDC